MRLIFASRFGLVVLPRRLPRRPPIVDMTCAACPVRRRCLEAALDVERLDPWTAHGYRGGLTNVERRELLLAERVG